MQQANREFLNGLLNKQHFVQGFKNAKISKDIIKSRNLQIRNSTQEHKTEAVMKEYIERTLNDSI